MPRMPSTARPAPCSPASSLLYTPAPLALQVEREQAEMQDGEPEAAPVGPVIKRPKHNTMGVGSVSGRPWKQPAQRAGTLRNPKLSSSWEKKMQVKATEKEYQERKQAAVAARKEKLAEERQRRAAAKKKKEEARSKAAIVQHVTTATGQSEGVHGRGAVVLPCLCDDQAATPLVHALSYSHVYVQQNGWPKARSRGRSCSRLQMCDHQCSIVPVDIPASLSDARCCYCYCCELLSVHY